MAIPVKVGGEIIVNAEAARSTPGAKVVVLADGSFVIVWSSGIQGDGTTGSDVRARFFNADGTADGDSIAVLADITGAQVQPSVAQLTNGKIVVSFDEVFGTGSDQTDWAVRGAMINTDGTLVRGFDVNSTTIGAQYGGRVTELPDGGFVVTWQDFSTQSDPALGVEIRAQVFNANMSKRGAEFVVNTSHTSAQMVPSVTELTNGNFVIAWWDQTARSDDTSSTSVRGQIFSRTGVPIGGEILLNSPTTGAQAFPVVTALSNGGFFVAYYDQSGQFGDTSTGGVTGQFFSATGTMVGSAFRVNTKTDGSQTDPAAVELADGRIAVVWSDYTTGSSDKNIRGQLVNADGTLSGEEFVVNTTTAGVQLTPSISAMKDGNFVVTWSDDVVTTDAEASVRAQVFNPDDIAFARTGTNRGDDMMGASLADTLNGAAGDDTIRGMDGDDVLFGANNNDLLFGGRGADRINGGNGSDRIEGGVGSDYMTGGIDADTFVFVTAADAATGGQRDRIADFEAGVDQIDLSAFLAGAGEFIGTARFSHQAGEFRYNPANGLIVGDLNGDGVSDFEILLVNKPIITADDFTF